MAQATTFDHHASIVAGGPGAISSASIINLLNFTFRAVSWALSAMLHVAAGLIIAIFLYTIGSVLCIPDPPLLTATQDQSFAGTVCHVYGRLRVIILGFESLVQALFVWFCE